MNAHPDSFVPSFRPSLLVGQICGLIPLEGASGGSKIAFTWTNPLHLYGLIITGITLFFDICYTIDNLKVKFGIDVFGSTVFYTVCLLTTVLFFRIAMKFPDIATDFQATDAQMADYGYPKGLALRIKIFLFALFFLASVEHGTLVCINLASVWRRSQDTGDAFAPLLYAIRFPPIERRIPYSPWTLALFFYTNIVCTFNWNYLDFFLITVSMEICSRFAQINDRILKTRPAKMNSKYFISVADNYNRLSLLTKKIDKKLGAIILTSFFSNLYHLSLQLSRSLKLNGSLFEKIYFYYSLSYLIARLLLVLLYASKVHEESKKPREILLCLSRALPPEGIRFSHRVLTDEIGFTGSKFFLIDRKFVVSVVGTIFTYQAFLLQFNFLNQEVGDAIIS